LGKQDNSPLRPSFAERLRLGQVERLLKRNPTFWIDPSIQLFAVTLTCPGSSPPPRSTRRLMALSFPTGAWYMRAGEKVMNFVMWLTRSGFRFYVHPPQAILATAAAAGLRPVQQKSSWPWQIVVFERAG
jgi:hypothetical protein